jgi:hypothetical protein
MTGMLFKARSKRAEIILFLSLARLFEYPEFFKFPTSVDIPKRNNDDG